MCERRGGLSQSGHWRLSMSDEANKAEQIATSTLTAVIYGAHAGSMGNEVGTDWVSERISLADLCGEKWSGRDTDSDAEGPY